ncbi:MAG: mismatch repair protein MutT [Mycobacterium sp.]|nr:mismatch repair protein MutT [Mycobacterium sp.]
MTTPGGRADARPELPAAGPVVVVAAAILRRGEDGRWRCLAARRREPPVIAGFWEFPGGKVERGETDVAALVRECREELGVEISVAGRLCGDLSASGGRVTVRVSVAQLVSGEPEARDHDQLRWLHADELASVPWLAADTEAVDVLRHLLAEADAGRGPTFSRPVA